MDQEVMNYTSLDQSFTDKEELTQALYIFLNHQRRAQEVQIHNTKVA
jgi:hypothetical protein